MPPPGEKRNHRKIPESLRKRAVASCDRCKQRRVRCLRPPGQESCTHCLQNNVACQTTLPRKQRIYGSVETLNLRYRALDALVRGLFKDEVGDDAESIFRIAEARNIPMPALDEQSPTSGSRQGEDALAVLHQPPASPTFQASTATDSSPRDPFSSKTVAEEKLIPTPHGVSHYVGPSSSFRFASTIRSLVAQCNAALDHQQQRRPNNGLRRDFANMKSSIVLEPRNSERVIDDSQLDQADQPQTTELPVRPHPSQTPQTPVNAPKSALVNDWRDVLPSSEVADVTIRAFFDRVHPNFQLFHRGMFQTHYEALRDAIRTNQPIVEPDWVFCLSMVFVLGAQALEQTQGDAEYNHMADVQKRYISLVRSRLQRLISNTSLVNVQALMLLQLYEHNAGERNNAWVLLGCALRMAQTLGMHREGTNSSFDPIERNIRRRVWWTMYLFEQNLAVVLGRPSAVHDTEVNVGLPEEMMIDCSDYPPDYLENAIRLSTISGRVKRIMYDAADSKDVPATVESAKRLLHECEAWRAALPQHLRPEWLSMMPKQRRAVLLLHVQHRHTMSVIARPCLVFKASNDVARLAQRDLPFPEASADVNLIKQQCEVSAREAIELLDGLANANLLDGVGWLDAYYVYHAILVLSLDFLARPRDAADTEEDVAKRAAVTAIIQDIQRTKLAPTYHILAQVGIQFARIVGAVTDMAPEPDSAPLTPAAQAMQQPRFQSVQTDPHASAPHAQMNGLPLMGEMSEIPWDFFATGLYMDSFAMGQQQAGPPQAQTFGGSTTDYLNVMDGWQMPPGGPS